MARRILSPNSVFHAFIDSGLARVRFATSVIEQPAMASAPHGNWQGTLGWGSEQRVGKTGATLFRHSVSASMTDDANNAHPEHEVTRLLAELRRSPEQFDLLMPLLYEDMKRIGRAQRRRLSGSPTLQTTALVHEAFLKLRRSTDGGIENRQHFKRLLAKVMRQLILDYARQQLAAKRGGGWYRDTWNEADHAVDASDLVRILAIEQALIDMMQSDSRMAEAMAAHLYAGMSVEEIGEAFGVSSRTIVRDLRKARAWLKIELRDFEDD